VFSHGSGRGSRRMSTFLCTHLASHGYIVAALDHSEVFARELAPVANENEEQRTARAEAWIANRVPDVRFLLDHLTGAGWESEARLDSERIGIVGYSFGGWTALAVPEADRRIRAVVALVPGGSSNPKPGIIPAKLTFAWGRDVPTLYLAAEDDVIIPMSGMDELFSRTPSTKQMAILRRADHTHFMDHVEVEHETFRALPLGGRLAWIPKEMRPIAELCSGEEAHVFTRGLTLAHFDAVLEGRDDARRFLAGDIEGELAARGAHGFVHRA
jgi:predicted dienelactone hydrolase